MKKIKIIIFVCLIIVGLNYCKGKIITTHSNQVAVVSIGPDRTMNSYANSLQLDNKDVILLGGYTYIDGSVDGSNKAELYSITENKFIKLQDIKKDDTLDLFQVDDKVFIVDSFGKKNVEVYDINTRKFIEINSISLDTKNLNVNKYKKGQDIVNKKRNIYVPENFEEINLNNKWSLLYEKGKIYDCSLKAKLYDKENHKLLDSPNLFYCPNYSAPIIELDNNKFLIAGNNDGFSCSPIVNTQIIEIK